MTFLVHFSFEERKKFNLGIYFMFAVYSYFWNFFICLFFKF